MSTLSRTTSFCDRRLATSGAGPPVSLRMISILLPPQLPPPCCFMYVLMPLSIWLPASANCPDSVSTSPIRTVLWACAGSQAASTTAPRAAPSVLFILPPGCCFGSYRAGGELLPHYRGGDRQLAQAGPRGVGECVRERRCGGSLRCLARAQERLARAVDEADFDPFRQ